MPTNVGPEIIAQAAPDVFVGFVLSTETVECQTLHGQCLAMFGVLWIREDLFGEFQAILVLFHLIGFLEAIAREVKITF